MIAPDDPRHGTYAGAVRHYSEHSPLCPPCRDAARKYRRRRKAEAEMGLARTVSTKRAAARIRNLMRAGMTREDIARAAGVSESAIHETLHKNQQMLRTTADAILGVRTQQTPTASVPAIGTRRRLQALGALGWSQGAIVAEAKLLGVPLTYAAVAYIHRDIAPNVLVRTRDAVAAVYDSLAMKLPPSHRGSTNARTLAQARGWLPPLAWDDIDDPNERPSRRRDEGRSRDDIDEAVVLRILAGERLPATRAEKQEVTRRWVARGGTLAELERRTGWKVDRYTRKETAA